MLIQNWQNSMLTNHYYTKLYVKLSNNHVLDMLKKVIVY